MTTVNWKTGLQRLYFVVTGIWYCFITFILGVELVHGGFGIPEFLIWVASIAVPVALYFLSIWIWQGFYESEK